VSAAAPTAAIAHSAANNAGRDDARHMNALATLPAFATGSAASVLPANRVATSSGPPLALAAIGTTILRL
jgi:hypothetical protein